MPTHIGLRAPPVEIGKKQTKKTLFFMFYKYIYVPSVFFVIILNVYILFSFMDMHNKSYTALSRICFDVAH